MNALKSWVVRSRAEQARAPKRYLAYWWDRLFFTDETNVLMSQDQYDEIKRYCGRYDGTWPTGEYLGKMFLRHDCLCWFGIAKDDSMNSVLIRTRIIEIVDDTNELYVWWKTAKGL